MSYNYDINPWDDDYNSNQSAQPTGAYAGAYTDGFVNPMAQYANQSAGQQQQGQQYEYQFQDSNQNHNEQQYEADPASGGRQPDRAQESTLRRFLRQHVPLCGPIMDTVSNINLPFLDALVQNINRDLLVSKIFYFFFYSAFGSLFPLMGVYFKQLGMNPAQVGILTGIRPFIEIFSAPFWNSLAEKFHKSKSLLLFSLWCWIIFTYSLAHIRPPASACVAFNDTSYLLYTPYSADDLSNYDVGQLDDTSSGEANKSNEIYLDRMPSPDESTNTLTEGRDKILAKEENQNDERRRKRQIYEVQDEIKQDDKNKFVYTLEGGSKDEGYESHLELDVDLENDLDDKLISDQQEPNNRRQSFFEVENSEGRDYEESEQLYSQGSLRFRRNARDVEGESYEQEESSDSKEDEKVKGGSRENDDEGVEEEASEGEGDVSPKTGSNRPAVKSNQEPEETTASVSTATTTIATQMPSGGGNNISQESSVNKTKRIYKQRHKTPPTHIVGMSPITVEYAANYKKEKHSQFVTPMFSTIVYKLDDIKEVFFLLLLLICLGEFFSAPALTLADSATLCYLGENTDLYGRQRMFGSLSWAITLLLVGMALDNATSIADHPCGPHQRERSYTVCFMIFSLLMACALLTATQFRFNYPKSVSGGGQTLVTSTNDSNTVITTTITGAQATGNIDQLYASTQPRSIFNTAPPVNAPPSNGSQTKEKFEFLDKWKSAVFAQRTGELPEWVNVFRQFKNSLHLTYLFITWFLGCGVGLVFTFLFWHLQDVGGTPTLFGICSVINHISEILAYFFSFNFIKRFGHTKVLSVGLGCNVIRFLYVAFLTDPYYALPFELVQGITHAACFAACCSYLSHVSKPELRTSTQGVITGLHHGIGRACGALIGGYMINAIGSRASFCIYGLLSGCVLTGFLYVRRKFSQLDDEVEVKVDDGEALGGYGAPQGVPSAIPGKITSHTVSTQDIDYQW